MKDFLTLAMERRSIRKYTNEQIPLEDLNKIIEAGLYAPNAGGGQRAILRVVHNAELTNKIGKLNIAKLDRSRFLGSYVSKEQPSIIDDPKIKSGFYGAPTVCVIFGMENFLYSIADAFCCATQMVLEAKELGISSCIIARAEETFDNLEGEQLLREWEVPENYIARCFVILGYCNGDYPVAKPRKENRVKIIS